MLRRRRVIVSEELLVELLQSDSDLHLTVKRGLPPDAKVLLVTTDRERGELEIEFTSSRFDPVNDTARAPLHPLELEMVRERRGSLTH